MVKRLLQVVLFLFFFAALVTPATSAKVRHVTILYTNNINGEIYPRG